VADHWLGADVRTLFLSAALSAAALGGPPQDPNLWPEAVVPPDDSWTFLRFQEAVWRSNAEWWVADDGGRVLARPYQPTEPTPPFFRELTALPELVRRNFDPNLTAVEVKDGWLVGYDGGEWGAAVVWYSADGKASRQVCEDPVNQFVTTKDGVFAATGLDHLGFGRGAVIRFVQKDKTWKPETVAVLPESAAVAASALKDGKLLVATGHRVVRVGPDGTVQTLVSSPSRWPFRPNSVAADDAGRVYFGMRQFVAVYDPKDPGGWVRLRTATKNWLPPPRK
jgi:hypothetical protein